MTTEQVQPPSQFNRVLSLLQTGPRGLFWRFVDQFLRKRRGYPLWHTSKITDLIYVGGQHYPKGWSEMQREGIEAVLNMRETHHDDVAKGIDSDHHLHCATRDNTPPPIEDLVRVADFIEEQVNVGRKIYIHCGVGVGRAPTAAAAYFIKTGMGSADALQHIKKERPFIHLTHGQRVRLHEFETYLRDQASTK